jgi:hypothetical protein
LIWHGFFRAPRQRDAEDIQLETKLFRSREVIAVLVLVAALICGKHVPVLSALPLAAMAGIVCFAFAIYLSLKIYAAELARIRAE